jgi:hypothetical protein
MLSQCIRRFPFLLALAFALSACGAASGPSVDAMKATQAAALTDVALTLQATPLPSATPSPGPTEEVSATLSPTLGPTRTATRPAVIAPLCDDSAYVSDVSIPDGTVMQPGEEFIKTWSIRNTGTCSWTTAYALDFVSGKRMDGVITYVPHAVDPGDVLEISIGLVAPSDAGTHTSYWRLKNADGNFFGEMVYVQIVVPGGSATSAPTAGITNTLEPTAESPAP